MAKKTIETVENSTATINNEEPVVLNDTTNDSPTTDDACGHHGEDGCTCEPGHCSESTCANYWVEETNSENGKKGKHHYATDTTSEVWEYDEEPAPTPSPEPDPEDPNDKGDDGDGKGDTDCPYGAEELADEIRIHTGIVYAKDWLERAKELEGDKKERAIKMIKGAILSWRVGHGPAHIDSIVEKIDSYFA